MTAFITITEGERIAATIDASEIAVVKRYERWVDIHLKSGGHINLVFEGVAKAAEVYDALDKGMRFEP